MGSGKLIVTNRINYWTWNEANWLNGTRRKEKGKKKKLDKTSKAAKSKTFLSLKKHEKERPLTDLLEKTVFFERDLENKVSGRRRKESRKDFEWG